MSIKDYDINELLRDYKDKYNIKQPDFEVAIEIADALNENISIESAIELLKEKNQGSCPHSDIAKMVTALNPSGLELLENIEGKELNFEEKISLLTQTLPLEALMNRYNEEKMKLQLLETLALTKVYLPYEDIDLIYPQELIDTRKEKRPVFVLENNNGDFQLTTVYKLLSDQTYTLNINDINFEKLVNLANMWVAAQINGYGSAGNSPLTKDQKNELSKSLLMSTHLIKSNIKNPKKKIDEAQMNKLTKKAFKENLSQKEINSLKKTAQEIHSSIYKDVDAVAKAFVNAHKNGRNIKTTFNNKKLYSFETKTINDVYVKCTGKTKEEHIQEEKIEKETVLKKFLKEQEEYDKMRAGKVKELLKYSDGIVDNRLMNEWKNCLKNFFDTKEIYVAIDIIKALKQGKPLEEAQKILNENKGISTQRVNSIILNFSERGSEFVNHSNVTLLKNFQILVEQQKLKFQAMSNNFSNNEMKDYLIRMLMMTDTPISKKDAQDLLPQKITDKMIDNGNYIVRRESYGYYLGIFSYQEYPFINLSGNKDEIDVIKLAKLLKNTMTAHKNSNNLHGNSILTKEDMEDVLDLTLKTVDYILETANEKSDIAEEVFNNDTTTISTSSVDEQEFNDRE